MEVRRGGRTTAQSMWAASLVTALSLLCVPASAAPPVNGTYVVSGFYPAGNTSEADCPQGLNPGGVESFRLWLRQAGKNPQEIEEIIGPVNFLSITENPSFRKTAENRARVNGKPANIYLNPYGGIDPQIKVGEGKYGYGFDLDGKEDASDFIEAETGERGIDNQVSRVFACYEATRSTPDIPPNYDERQWQVAVTVMPAWLMEVRGIEDQTNDDDVEIRFFRATGSVWLNGSGRGGVQNDMTFKVGPELSVRRTVKAAIRNGVVVSDAFEFYALGDPFWMPEVNLKKARIRLKFGEDGVVRALLGGFIPTTELYWAYAQKGFAEGELNTDTNGLYWAMHRLADGEFDPRTNGPTISTTYSITAVPAFFTPPDQAAVSKPTRTAAR